MQRKKDIDVCRNGSDLEGWLIRHESYWYASQCFSELVNNLQKAFEFTRNDPSGAPEEGSEDCLYMVQGSLIVWFRINIYNLYMIWETQLDFY